jgi:hypothetical protein
MIACGQQVGGNLSGAFGDSDDATCGYTFQWQDNIIEFDAGADATVTATYTSSPDPQDGALLVMAGSCHANLCVATSLDSGDRHSVTFDAVAGLSYYIVFEGPSNQPSFTVSLSCS